VLVLVQKACRVSLRIGVYRTLKCSLLTHVDPIEKPHIESTSSYQFVKEWDTVRLGKQKTGTIVKHTYKATYYL